LRDSACQHPGFTLGGHLIRNAYRTSKSEPELITLLWAVLRWFSHHIRMPDPRASVSPSPLANALIRRDYVRSNLPMTGHVEIAHGDGSGSDLGDGWPEGNMPCPVCATVWTGGMPIVDRNPYAVIATRRAAAFPATTRWSR
jgi:hypothetical protein